jgi:5-methylcytosine-specific restriction endonuclease McrA
MKEKKVNIFSIRLKSDNSNQISQFNRDLRKTICELIYYKITKDTPKYDEIVGRTIYELKFKDLNHFWKNKITEASLEEISSKLNNNDFEIPIKNYIKDLFEIVYKMHTLSKDKKFLNFTEFISELIEDGITLCATDRGLESIIPEIYSHLRENFIDEFTLKRVRRKSSNISKSSKRSIELFSKKLKLCLEIYDGLYNGKCVSKNCKVNYKMLPALEFHHKHPNIKTSTFNDIAYKRYDDIKSELSNQQVELICNNCHSCKDSTTFNKYSELISQKDLFYDKSGGPISPRVINENIDKYLIKKLKLDDNLSEFHKIRYEVKKWIKKRYIVEVLFDGHCINCGEHRLPCLEFHHVKPESKQNVWGEIFRSWSIKRIIKNFIIKEGCVCLCANCHSLINSKNFKAYYKEILDMMNRDDIFEFYNRLENNIRESYNKVRNYYPSIHFRDPLKKLFEKGDTWKETLIYIYYLSNIRTAITNKDLNRIIGKYVKINQLLNNAYICKKGKVGNATLFNLSVLGRLEALNIIKTLRKENPIDFMDLEEEITNKLNRIK